MHTYLGRLCTAVALAVLVVGALPAVAQQNTNSQQRPRQVAPPASGTRQALPPTSNSRQPAPSQAAPRGTAPGHSPVRQTAGQAPVPGDQGAAAAPAPRAPFALTPQQQQLLDQILIKWEAQSERVKTFKCTFGRWEINPAFGPKENNFVLSEGEGLIKFKAPDHGIYIVRKQREWDAQKKTYVARTEGLDHWVCNGEAIFEYNAPQKQLIERQLAPELRGKAITEGPLPFIFGAKADQLKRRYWMRDVTPREEVNKSIRLEAWPKFQQDAANFQHAIVILDQRNFMPQALRIVLPDGQNKQDYQFQDTKVNDPLSILKADFLPPFTPLGWQHVVEPPMGARAAAPAAAPAEPPAQARGPAAAQRK